MPHRLRAGNAGSAVDWVIGLSHIQTFFEPEPGAATSGHFEPGEQLDFAVEATVSAYEAELSPDPYISWLRFEDETYGTSDVEVHLLYVGAKSFSAGCVPSGPFGSCQNEFLGQGPSGAVGGELITYLLRSRWDVDQTIDVNVPSWSVVSGGGDQGTTISFTLGPGGEELVTVEATGLGVGTQEGQITFSSSISHGNMHIVQFLIRGDLGRLVAAQTPSQEFTPGSMFEVDLPLKIQELPLLDVDFCLEAHVTDGTPGELVSPPNFRLRSPANVEVDLGSTWGQTCWSDELFVPPPRARVLQAADLLTFEGGPLGGTWTLIVDAPTTPEWEEAVLDLAEFRFGVESP
jgi:hypothetical protein